MADEREVPQAVLEEFQDALETWAGEWLWEAERCLGEWEEDGEGHTVLMPVEDGDGTPMEEGSQWMGEGLMRGEAQAGTE